MELVILTYKGWIKVIHVSFKIVSLWVLWFWFTCQEKKRENKLITQNFDKRFGFMKKLVLRRSKIPACSVENGSMNESLKKKK